MEQPQWGKIDSKVIEYTEPKFPKHNWKKK